MGQGILPPTRAAGKDTKRSRKQHSSGCSDEERNAISYARVSTMKQADNDLSIPAQLKANREYADRNNINIIREFIDEGKSGRTRNRPAFQEMLRLASEESDNIDVILVWKLSRFARNQLDSEIFREYLHKNGVELVSINEPLDDSPQGILTRQILAAIDEFYVRNMIIDIVRGLRENASRGNRNGGIPPIGYLPAPMIYGKQKVTTLVLDMRFAPIVKRIFADYLAGNGCKEIAKQLNLEGVKTNRGRSWSSTTIHKVLTNEAYTGTLVWGKTYMEDGKRYVADEEDIIRIEEAHPSIIDAETFGRVQKRLNQSSPVQMHPRRVNSKYLLSGILCCGKCGYSMQGRSGKSGKYSYYHCGNQTKRGKTECSAIPIPQEYLEEFVIEKLRDHLFTEDNILELIALVKQELDGQRHEDQKLLIEIDQQIRNLDERLERLYNAVETGQFDDALPARISERAREKNELEKRRADIRSTQEAPIGEIDAAEIRRQAQNLGRVLAQGTVAERKEFLSTFIKKVEVDLPRVSIEYSIPVRPGLDADVARARSTRIVQPGAEGGSGMSESSAAGTVCPGTERGREQERLPVDPR